MDWKEMLGQLRESGTLPEPEDDATADAATEEPQGATQKEALRVVTDRKGRKGKTATIVEGFTIDDAEVAAIAGMLRRRLGLGGSSRGGEILIQGDVRERVAAALREAGFKVK